MNDPITPTPLFELNIHKGVARPIVAVALTIFVANYLLLFHFPGISWGIFAVYLGALLIFSRKDFPKSSAHYAAFGLLLLSALQTARFLSLSNFLVISILLLALSGESAHTNISKSWVRWFEGLISLVRPLGSMFSFRELEQQRKPSTSNFGAKFKHGLIVGLPVIVVVIVFGMLLSSGNAVLGKWSTAFFSSLSEYIDQIRFPSFPRFSTWVCFGAIGLIIACPARVTHFASSLPAPWRILGEGSTQTRKQQWILSLGALNVLFLFSNVTDVIYLWSSQKLPQGISHSEYVHQGVYALIATTILSALLMALLTQHIKEISRHPLTRILSLVWLVQNLILISGVYVRLSIYVNAYGYTSKRVYVALFLALVVIGYLFLGWALIKFKNIKWLIGSNLLLVFAYFSLLQFVDIPRIVTEENIHLYQEGYIEYPPNLYFKQVGSHSIPYLISIYENPQSKEHLKCAEADLQSQWNEWSREKRTGWRTFQLKNYNNVKAAKEFQETHPFLIIE